MEEYRRKFAESGLYPDLVPLRPKASKPSTTTLTSSSVISIASTASESSPEPAGINKKTPRAPIVISSDEEDEVASPPFRSQPVNNAQPRRASQQQQPGFSRPPVPIAVPTQSKIQRPTPPPMSQPPAASSSQGNDDQEKIEIPHIADLDDRIMTQADTEKALRDFVADVYNDAEMEYSIEDATVEGFRDGVLLLPHQVKSRQWMAERESGKKTGGILADDMGLGKTISTLTRIVEGRPSNKDKKAGWSGSTLVICPVALVSQWESEVKKYTSGLRVIQHHGASRTTDPTALEKAHIVVTSYSTVTSEHGVFAPAKDEGKGKGKGKKTTVQESDSDEDSDDFSKRLKKSTPRRGKQKDSLFRVKWWRVVLDEAHNIKNRNTKAATACCALNSKYRWCLTGTPMQNNVEEIYSLIKFLRISPLNDWGTFSSSIAQPVKSGRPVRALKRLQVVLRAIMLRRTKTTIINGKPIVDLPPRLVNVVDCEFNHVEREFYNSVEQKVQNSLEQLQMGDINKAYTSVLVLLLRLRQACDHPTLISKDYKGERDGMEPQSASQNMNSNDEGDELVGMLAGLGLDRKCQVCQTVLAADNTWKENVCVDCEEVYRVAQKAVADPNSDLPPHSSKTRMIVKLLNEAEERGEGEKTIIFSQFTSMLDLIEPFLKREGIKFVRYDGSMNKAARDVSIDEITNSRSTKVILISFKAGSTGLNLTCCNNVILVDPWWNPALEDQAFDRAHRFGQKRAVNIHKLSVPDSVEQRILELQEKKRALTAATLSGDKLKNMRLGIDELVALFRATGHDDDED